jgi:hypothetical protein
MELAKSTNVPVLFTAVEIPIEVAEPIKSADAPVVVELKRAPIMAIRPTGEEVQLAVAVTPPPVMAAAASEPARTLPGTASSVPMIAMFGMLALLGAFALRTAARRLQ